MKHQSNTLGDFIPSTESYKRVQAIIPTLNEENTIAQVIEHTENYVDEVLVIDGNSYDNTVSVVKKNQTKIIIQKGVGKGNALREAFEEAVGDIIIILDADGSMHPNEIPRFLEEISSGADVVKGSRFIEGGGSEDLSFIRTLGNIFFVKLTNFLYGLNLTDICYGYMGFTKNAIIKLRPELSSNGFDIETEIILQSAKLGLDIREIPSFEQKRKYGKSNLNAIRDGFKILKVILSKRF